MSTEAINESSPQPRVSGFSIKSPTNDSTRLLPIARFRDKLASSTPTSTKGHLPLLRNTSSPIRERYSRYVARHVTHQVISSQRDFINGVSSSPSPKLLQRESDSKFIGGLPGRFFSTTRPFAIVKYNFPEHKEQTLTPSLKVTNSLSAKTSNTKRKKVTFEDDLNKVREEGLEKDSVKDTDVHIVKEEIKELDISRRNSTDRENGIPSSNTHHKAILQKPVKAPLLLTLTRHNLDLLDTLNASDDDSSLTDDKPNGVSKRVWNWVSQQPKFVPADSSNKPDDEVRSKSAGAISIQSITSAANLSSKLQRRK
ncbi:unnamed protein product [Dimorphilus gyrociliatus]|uniref:Uncharacterized protein n=1 Tax=Dimorphilus gyrociliatus TaxID=2664684 RepID=A0A7I8WA60_9ANNE|nr:unnamed protein product [Dimorphilus gyrociliatus]